MTENSTLNSIIEVLESKKACDICVMDVHEKTSLADYFVVCHGTSPTHCSTLMSSLVMASKGTNSLLRADKSSSNEWKVLDYGDIIVHIFLEDSRSFYDLEKIWQADDPIKALELRADLHSERKPIDVKSLFNKAMGNRSRSPK